jgi:hypothetical protein
LAAAAVSAALVVQLPAEAQLPVLADPVVRAEQPVLAERVVQAAASVEEDSVEAVLLCLLSRQSYSAAMAGSTPQPGAATYEPVPRSR